MISRQDISQALAVCTAYDSQHTPVPDKQIITAWVQHFEQFPGVTPEDLGNAVREYHNAPHDHLVRPVDLSAIARKYSRERYERSSLDSPERRHLEAICDTKAAPDRAAIEGAAFVRQAAIENYARRFGISSAEAAVRMDPRRDAANTMDATAVEVNHIRQTAPPAPLRCPDCGSLANPCQCDATEDRHVS